MFANSSLVRPSVRCFCCLFLFARIFQAILDSCDVSSKLAVGFSWSSRPLFILALDLVGSNVFTWTGWSNTCFTFSATGGFGNDPRGSIFHSFVAEVGVLGLSGVVGFESALLEFALGIKRLRLLAEGWLSSVVGALILAFKEAWRFVIRGIMLCPDRPMLGSPVSPIFSSQWASYKNSISNLWSHLTNLFN